jgi:sec-independent protein translocase protein TatA
MLNSIFLWTPGWGEMVLIALMVLLLFGGKKIPELARGIGKGIREFNSARANIKDELDSAIKGEEPGSGKSSDEETKEESKE